MKTKGITFDELRRLLLERGCEMIDEETRISFSHPALGTFLLFRPYRPKEIVHPRDLLVVRRQLVDNGLIEDADLDRFLQKASA